MKLLQLLLAGVLTLCTSLVLAQGMIDLNTASAEELSKGIKGIGAKKAAAIVKYREVHGPFQSVDELSKVPGIKAKTVEQIKPVVTVGGTAAPSALPQIKGPANPALPSATPATVNSPANPAIPTAPRPLKGPSNATLLQEPPPLKSPANPQPQ